MKRYIFVLTTLTLIGIVSALTAFDISLKQGWNLVSVPYDVPDIFPPRISLVGPENNSVDETGNVTFRFTVIDYGSDVARCSLIINGTPEITNTTINESTVTSFTKNLSNGYYLWKINCTDSSTYNNTASTESRLLRVYAPIIHSEIKNFTGGQSNIVNASVANTILEIIPTANLTNVTLTVTSRYSTSANGTLNATWLGRYIEINSSVLEGNVSWMLIKIYYTSSELVGLNESTLAIYYHNNTWFRLVSTVNTTEKFVQANVTHLSWYTPAALDTTAPFVNLTNPENDTTDNYGNATFSYTVTDFSVIANCSLIMNGTINQTGTSVTRNTPHSFLLNMTNGTYSWSINCTDSYGNSNASETRLLTVDLVCDADCNYCNFSNCNSSSAAGGCYWDVYASSCFAIGYTSCANNCSACSTSTMCSNSTAEGGCTWDSYEDECYNDTAEHCSLACYYCNSSESICDHTGCEWDPTDNDEGCYDSTNENHCNVNCGACDDEDDCEDSDADCIWKYYAFYDDYWCESD